MPQNKNDAHENEYLRDTNATAVPALVLRTYESRHYTGLKYTYEPSFHTRSLYKRPDKKDRLVTTASPEVFLLLVIHPDELGHETPRLHPHTEVVSARLW